MKKAIKLLFILLFAFVSTFTLSACNKTFEAFEYIEENGEIIITAYNDNSKVSVARVPDEIDGKPVVRIDNFALTDTLYVKEIIIGKNVREIGEIGVKNNAILEKFTLAEGNTHFKTVDGVLYSANGEELISYPKFVGAIAKEVVNDSGKTVKEYVIPKVTIADGVKYIRAYAFYHVNIIEEIDFNQVEVIGEAAFLRSSKLNKITLSKQLTRISGDAFSQNQKLEEILIYENITEIQANAFYNCKNLLTINICTSKDKVTLGKKWYPTDLGKDIDTLVVNWDYIIPEEEN